MPGWPTMWLLKAMWLQVLAIEGTDFRDTTGPVVDVVVVVVVVVEVDDVVDVVEVVAVVVVVVVVV